MAPTPSRLKQSETALLLAFLLVGHATLSSVAWVPEYIDRLGVSFATWGTILGFSTIGAIIPLMFASRLIMRFGSRPIMRIGLYVGMVLLMSLSLRQRWMSSAASFTSVIMSTNTSGEM